MPMATPPTMRYVLYSEKLSAIPVPTAETVNRSPERMSRRLRPNRSETNEQATAPMMQPTSAELVPQPLASSWPSPAIPKWAS